MRALAVGFDPDQPGDADRLRDARRVLGHDVLVLFVPDADHAEVRDLVDREEGTGGRVRTSTVPPGNARDAFEVMRDAFDGLRDEGLDVRACVSGGTVPMSVAALLACLATSTEAWFFDAGRHERLAVPRRQTVTETFTDVERDVLARLDRPRTVDDLVASIDGGRQAVMGALLRLRNAAVVAISDGATVTPTPVGQYYREHLGGPGTQGTGS